MSNSLVLLRVKDTGGPRHGGYRIYRNFEFYINNVLIRRFADDSQNTGYNSGKNLDQYIDRYLAPLEKALNAKTVRAKVKETFTR